MKKPRTKSAVQKATEITHAKAYELFDSLYVGYLLPGQTEPSYVPFVFSPEPADKRDYLGGFADGAYDILDEYGDKAAWKFEDAVTKEISKQLATGIVKVVKVGSITWWLAEKPLSVDETKKAGK